jgi:WD40 repeat protein
LNEGPDLREKTMPMLRLMLDPEGTAVEVDDAMLIGACATQLAAQHGYPQADRAGRPKIYQLRLSASGSLLPNDQRFRHFQLTSGTRFTLVSSTASAPTRPVHAVGFPAATQSTTRHRRRWSRRAFLTTGTLGAFALSGLGTGLIVALAQRSLGRRRPATAPLVSSTASSTAAPRIVSATPTLTFASHQQTVRVVAWSPDGRYLASGGDDGLLLVWGTDGVVRQRVAFPASVTALAWSPESERLVTGAANQVTFLTALTETVLASFPHDHLATVTSLAWTVYNQQQVVSSALDQRAIVWQTTQYQPQTIFTRHTAPIEAVSWAKDGQTIASASHGGVVRIWNAESGREVHPLYQDARLPMRAAAFAPTGTQLAVGGDDSIIRLWNGLACQNAGVINGGPICVDMPRRLQTSHNSIRSLAWSPDARYLASSGDGGSFSLWDPAQSQKPLLTMPVQTGTPVLSLAWSPIGNQLATASGKAVIVWELHVA